MAQQGRRMHWIARYPGLGRLEWDAELNQRHQPGQRIAWRSLPNSPLRHEGEVRFLPAAGGRWMEVHALLRYAVPGGGLGRLLGRAASGLPAARVKDDLRRFKELMEAGEIATTAGQPSGRERKD